MPPLPADSIHARACKLKCEKILTRPIDMLHYTFFPQDQKTLERLLSQLIAARLLAPPRKEDRR